MQFLFPSVLWGLLALAIPIIIHLFHFRRYKQVYFTNVRFLKELKDERSANRKLRNLLVLLARCLAFAFLIFAFAQPFLGDNTKTLDQKLVSVFVDNSYSMSSKGKDVSLLDNAKKRATEIVQAFSETDRFQVLSHNYSAISSKILSKEDALAEIENITTTPRIKSLNTILQKQVQTFDQEEGTKSYFMISDFQKSIMDLQPNADTVHTLNLIPLTPLRETNLSVDSAYFTSPAVLKNQNNSLVVKLTNYSNEAQDDVILSVFQDGQKKPAGSFDIKANSSVLDTINLTFLEEGQKDIKLQIQDYPIQFDDSYHLSLVIAPSTKVLSIYDALPNKYIKALFAGIAEIQHDQSNQSKLDYSSFKEFKLIVLEDLRSISSGLASELRQYIEGGGNVLCFPSKTADINSYNAFYSQLNVPKMTQWVNVENEVFAINTEEFVFNKVYKRKSANADLPIVKGNYDFESLNRSGGEALLTLRSGAPFVQKYLRNKGHIYVCKSPIDRSVSSLVEHAEVFVPMIYKMAYARGEKATLAYEMSKNTVIEIDNADLAPDAIFSIVGEGGEIIPQQQNVGGRTEIKIKDEIQNAGFYKIASGGKDLANVAFNFSREESDPTTSTIEELNALTGDYLTLYDEKNSGEFLARLKENEEGVFLWKWCLIFALIFLAIETLILRFWK